MKQNKNGTDYYLSRNGNSISTVTDVNGAAEWYVDSDNYLFFYNGSTPYYIAYDQSFSTSKTSGSWTTNYSFRLDANNHLYGVTNPFFGSTQYKFLTLSSTTYAFSSPSTSSKAPDGAATLAFERGKINSTTATSSLTGSGPDYATSNAGMRYDGDDVTFFPLGAKETPTDGSATHDEGLYEALFQNTGYVVGGYNYTSEPSKYDRTDPTIRVAEYAGATDYIKNYNGSGFTNVLTVDENNTVQEINESSNNYEKYADSKDAFLKILGQSSGNLYGLHFMQADINKDYLVTAPYARINGEPYDDYQMPANSIDFRLKQKGYVNFFAGSYMSGYTVDSFFSLHRIIRDSEDESTIESIEEIEEVYSDYDEDDLKTSSHSYIYRVKDKENSTPSTTVWKYTRPYRLDSMGQRVEIEKDAQGQNVPYAGGYLSEDDFAELTDYYSVFNTSRIKKNTLTQNQCYYFEVPVNEGEYCLGSVSNGTAGGYLLYLDIGANAQKNNRTEVYEKFVRTVSLSSYVENFVLVESASTVMAALITTDPQGARVRKEGAADLNAADSIAFRVKAGQAGDVVIERESNVITLSRSGPPDTEITYAAHGMTLREQTGESAYSAISLVTETPTETIFNRLTLLDWDASNSVATVTTITDETGQSRLIAQTKGGETVATPVVYKGTNYGDAAGNAFSADELAALDITYSPASTIMEFDYYAEAATTIATDFALQSNLDEETGFFTLNGYEFDITRTGSANFTAYVTKTTATITVVIDEQNVQYTFTYKINGTSVTAPTTVLINRAPAN